MNPVRQETTTTTATTAYLWWLIELAEICCELLSGWRIASIFRRESNRTRIRRIAISWKESVRLHLLIEQVPRGYIRCDYFIVTYCTFCQFFIITFIILSFWCHFRIVLDFLLLHEKFRRYRSMGNDVFRRSKITRDIRTDLRTDGRTWLLIGMRSRI